MCSGKGLETLVDAYLELRRKRPGRVLLHVAGAMTPVDEPLVKAQRRKLERAGVLEDAVFLPNVTHEQKVEFFRKLSVFSVPATYGEAFGLFVLEALASAVPVVQPDHGAFPEVLALSGGGVLCRPDDPADLAAKWAELLDRPEEARALGRRGQAGVRAYFTAERMTDDLLRVFEEAVLEGQGVQRMAVEISDFRFQISNG
jgi:glycosyltransferase involved in cell wall biosynthesis